MPNKNKYIGSKENFRSIVKTCKSMAEASKKLNLPFSTFKRYAEKYDCYNPNQVGKGIVKQRKKLNDVVNNISSIKTTNLKTKLFNLGIKFNRCEMCGLSEIWNGKSIIMEMHHIDGNSKNNELSNLQILCPNCHSQTHNFRRKKQVVKEETL